VAVTKMTAAAIAMCAVLLARPARAEPVYEFVKDCRDEALGHCFNRIATRLSDLNAGGNRRICLPRTFGGTMVESGVIPVSLLEHVRLKLSAAATQARMSTPSSPASSTPSTRATSPPSARPRVETQHRHVDQSAIAERAVCVSRDGNGAKSMPFGGFATTPHPRLLLNVCHQRSLSPSRARLRGDLGVHATPGRVRPSRNAYMGQ
jgi:hypothetical protein